MKYCLVADDGQGRVVVAKCNTKQWLSELAFDYSAETKRLKSTAKFHVCRRDPSANGENLVTIETWEKGVKL